MIKILIQDIAQAFDCKITFKSKIYQTKSKILTFFINSKTARIFEKITAKFKMQIILFFHNLRAIKAFYLNVLLNIKGEKNELSFSTFNIDKFIFIS